MSIVKKKKLKGCKVTCGDCEHFSGTKKYSDKCENLGIIASSKAPSCYTPDLTSLKNVQALPFIEQLGEILKSINSKQARILTYVISKHAKNTTEHYFGQQVFVNLGEDYLSHYYKAFILDIDTESGYLYLVAKLKESKTASGLMLPIGEVLDTHAFYSKAKELIDSGKVVRHEKEFEQFRHKPFSDRLDKDGTTDVSKLTRLDLEELAKLVPDIDKAPKEKVKKLKKNAKVTSFIETKSGTKIKTLNTF